MLYHFTLVVEESKGGRAKIVGEFNLPFLPRVGDCVAAPTEGEPFPLVRAQVVSVLYDLAGIESPTYGCLNSIVVRARKFSLTPKTRTP